MEAKRLVCVIDDDRTYQKMMSIHLQQMGYDVKSLYSGDEVDHLDQVPFVILLDHHLSDRQTGLDIMKKVRKKLPGVPVVYMTSANDENVKSSAKKSGAFDFIEKDPASLVKLRTALDQIVEKSQKKGGWLTKLFN